MTAAAPTGAGGAFHRGRIFRLLYLPLTLLYVGLVLFWGRFDLNRIHREYRQAGAKLAGGYAQELAGAEVAAGCREAAGGDEAPGYGDCLRAANPLVVVRAAVIAADLRHARHQAGKKMAIFYSLLAAAILLPLGLLYLFLAFLGDLLSHIRFRKE